MSPRGRKGTPPEDPADVAREPIPAWAFVREFRKHRKTGEIWAVELVNGALSAAKVCTKPEELTDGALPVLLLDGDVSAYRKAQAECEAWEPEATPDGLRRNLVQSGHRLDDLDTKISKAKSTLKRLNESREEVVAQIRRYVRELETGQTNLLDAVISAAEPTDEVEAAGGFSTFVNADGMVTATVTGTDEPAPDEVASEDNAASTEETDRGATEDDAGEAGDHLPRGGE